MYKYYNEQHHRDLKKWFSGQTVLTVTLITGLSKITGHLREQNLLRVRWTAWSRGRGGVVVGVSVQWQRACLASQRPRVDHYWVRETEVNFPFSRINEPSSMRSCSWITGNWTCFSNHFATVKSCWSQNARPINCSPIGNPWFERATGTLTAGKPEEEKEVINWWILLPLAYR